MAKRTIQDYDFLLRLRAYYVEHAVKEVMLPKSEVAILFNIDNSRITRILKSKKKLLAGGFFLPLGESKKSGKGKTFNN